MLTHIHTFYLLLVTGVGANVGKLQLYLWEGNEEFMILIKFYYISNHFIYPILILDLLNQIFIKVKVNSVEL